MRCFCCPWIFVEMPFYGESDINGHSSWGVSGYWVHISHRWTDNACLLMHVSRPTCDPCLFFCSKLPYDRKLGHINIKQLQINTNNNTNWQE